MQRDNRNIVDQGWKDMQTLLDRELPIKNKVVYPWKRFSLILILAFIGGLIAGTQMDKIDAKHKQAQNIKSAETTFDHNQNTIANSQVNHGNTDQSIDDLEIGVAQNEKLSTIATANSIDFYSNQSKANSSSSKSSSSNLSKADSSNRSQSNPIRSKGDLSSERSLSLLNSNSIANSNNYDRGNSLFGESSVQYKSNHFSIVPKMMAYQTFFSLGSNSIIATGTTDVNTRGMIERLSFIQDIERKAIDQFPDSYMPRSDAKKFKRPSKWQGSLGLLVGLNPGRNTQIVNIETEIKYRISKSNSIGVLFGFGKEDNLFEEDSSFLRDPSDEPSWVISNEQMDRSEPESLWFSLKDAQSQFMTGLLVEHKFYPRFSVNLSSGITLLQNVYSQQTDGIGKRSSKEHIQYHWGAYSSLNFKYKLSRHIDLMLKGNKGYSIKKDQEYTPGNINQVFTGVSINF